MSYIPKPISTVHICLEQDILALGELLARNTHDVWAKERMDQGWTYGEARNDEKKEHPCLIPYEDLPESEKAYDPKDRSEAGTSIFSRFVQYRKVLASILARFIGSCISRSEVQP